MKIFQSPNLRIEILTLPEILTKVKISEVKISRYLTKKTIHTDNHRKIDAPRACVVLPGPPDKDYESDLIIAPSFLVFQGSFGPSAARCFGERGLGFD